MTQFLYTKVALIDTSAVIALHDDEDADHNAAKNFFPERLKHYLWCYVDVTAHETFTRVRYNKRSSLQSAIESFSFLSESEFVRLDWKVEDELEARRIIQKYSEHRLSFHDALCAAVMKREGILNIFSFDSHFTTLGFETLPLCY